MAEHRVIVQGRSRGLWRARLLGWLCARLLPGVRFEYRVGQGHWVSLPMSLDLLVRVPDDAVDC